MQVLFRWIAVVSGSALSVVPARASNWTGNAGNGSWFEPLNWSAGVPSAAEGAFVNVPTALTISLGGQTATASAATFSSFTSTFNLVNGTLRTSQLVGNSLAPVVIDTELELFASPSGAASISNVTLNRGLREDATNPPTSTRLTGTKVVGSVTSSNLSAATTDLLPNASVLATTFTINGAVRLTQLSGSSDRISDATRVALADQPDPLEFAAGSLPASERIGRLDIPAGAPAIVESGAGAIDLRIGTLSVAEGATLRWSTSRSSGHRLRIENAPSLVGGDSGTGVNRGVATWAVSSVPGGTTSSGLQLLTYDRGANPTDPNDDVGLRTLDLQIEFAQGLADGANSRITSATTVSGVASPKVLLVEGANALTIPAAARVEIDDGLLAFTGESATPRVQGSGLLRFTGRSQILAANFGTSNIDAPIQADALTLVLPQSLRLGAANAIGVLKINGGGGRLVLNAPDALAGTLIDPGASTARISLPLGGHQTFRFEGGTGSLALIGSPTDATFLDGTIDVRSLSVSTGRFVVARPVGLQSVSVAAATLDLTVPVALVSATLGADATLAATGTIGSLSYAATSSLAPGPAIGTLSLDTLSRGILFGVPPASYGTFVFDLDRVGGVPINDQINVGVMASSGTALMPINLVLHPTAAVLVGDTFLILQRGTSSGGVISPLFLGMSEGATFTQGGRRFSITYNAGDGNDVAVTIVPEPATLSLLAILGLAGRRRSRNGH